MSHSFSEMLGVRPEDKHLLYRTYFLYFCSGIMANSMGSILKDMRNPSYGYGFSAGFQGILSSAMQFGGLAANILSGLLPFLIGRKKSTVILALAPVLGLGVLVMTGNPALLIMSFICVGVGKGVNSNITNIVVNQTASRRGVAQNFLHSFVSIGAVMGPVLMALFLQEKWRWPAMTIGTMIFVAVVLIGQSSLSNEKEIRGKESIAIPRSFKYWYNTGIMFFYLCEEACLLSYTVSYFTYTGLFSDSASNYLASVLWIGILIGRLGCIAIMNKVRKQYLIATLGLCFIVSFIVMVNANTPAGALVSLFCVGLSMSGIYPTTMSTQEERYMKSSFCSGLCIGICTAATMIMPVIIGGVTNATGSYRTGLKTLLVPLSCMFALMVLKIFIECINKNTKENRNVQHEERA
ncbi:MAG: MFS transporter [Spirochaetales bacterium]|nr:MFS transporter [Spirochaetales bacterium]